MKIDLKNLFKKKQSFRKGGFHANPNIGWEIIVALAFVAVVASFTSGAYLFLETNAEFKVPSLGNDIRKEIVEEERIDKVLDYFTARAERSRKILSLPSRIVDPSK